jgi:hypothetical protein
MFIKAVKKHNPGGHTTFTYHRLVESYRTSRGPRQITLLNLGTLQLPKSKWRELAQRVEQLASGQTTIQPEDPEVETLARHYAPLGWTYPCIVDSVESHIISTKNTALI